MAIPMTVRVGGPMTAAVGTTVRAGVRAGGGKVCQPLLFWGLGGVGKQFAYGRVALSVFVFSSRNACGMSDSLRILLCK